MSLNLHAELKALALAVRAPVVRRLVGLGVNTHTIANMGLHHYSLGVVGAVGVADGLYDPDPDAPAHLVLPAYEDGELVDLVAFRTAEPHDWKLRVGDAWALGVEDGLADHYWAERVTLTSSPLDWMRAGCSGLCVVDWTSPKIQQLRDFKNIICADETLAATLERALSRRTRLPNITIQSGDFQYAAAA